MNLVMDKKNKVRDQIHKLVMDMDEETEIVFLEEIIKKRISRLNVSARNLKNY